MQMAGGTEPPMPGLVFGDDLIQALWDFGPVAPEGSAVSYAEIDAWARQTGRDLTRWEAETLRRMSKAYAVEQRAARKPTAEAPWQTVKLNRRVLVRHIKNVLAPFAKKKDKK